MGIERRRHHVPQPGEWEYRRRDEAEKTRVVHARAVVEDLEGFGEDIIHLLWRGVRGAIVLNEGVGCFNICRFGDRFGIEVCVCGQIVRRDSLEGVGYIIQTIGSIVIHVGTIMTVVIVACRAAVSTVFICLRMVPPSLTIGRPQIGVMMKALSHTRKPVDIQNNHPTWCTPCKETELFRCNTITRTSACLQMHQQYGQYPTQPGEQAKKPGSLGGVRCFRLTGGPVMIPHKPQSPQITPAPHPIH